jgi:HAMP domain-containing protein
MTMISLQQRHSISMRRFQMSLRTKVVLSLTFLMAAAMLLIGMVTLKVSQRDLLRAKVEQGLLLKGSLERLLNTQLSSTGGKLELPKSGLLLADFQTGSSGMLKKWRLTLADRTGQVVYSSNGNEPGYKQPLPGLMRVMRFEMENISFTPAPKPFWQLLPEEIILDAPLFRDSKIIGAVRLETSLTDVRQSLWQSQKLLLFYILLDILILVAFGTYIFSKLVVKPVQQLVQTADRFEEGDSIPDVSAGEQNELGKLSQALNSMLQRLAGAGQSGAASGPTGSYLWRKIGLGWPLGSRNCPRDWQPNWHCSRVPGTAAERRHRSG